MKKLAIIGCSHSTGVMLTAPPDQKPWAIAAINAVRDGVDNSGKQMDDIHEKMLEWGYWKGWPHDIYEKYNYETHVYSFLGGGIRDAFFTLNYFLGNNIYYDKIILQLTSEPRWRFYPMETTFKFKKYTNPNKKEMFFRIFPLWSKLTIHENPARREKEFIGGYYETYAKNLLYAIDYLPFDILAFPWCDYGTKTNLKYIIHKDGFNEWLENKLGIKQHTLHRVDYIINNKEFKGNHLDEIAQKYITEEYCKKELDKFLV